MAELTQEQRQAAKVKAGHWNKMDPRDSKIPAEAAVQIAQAAMELQEPQPGEMHEVDRAFHKLTVAQRDLAWRQLEDHAMLIGDPQHPQTLDYVATNILAHIDQMPNNGDWWGQLRNWAERHSSGRIKPNGAA